MDNPIFRLEGIVQERNIEELQDFEGPLDLILFLLSKNKIEIQNIPIALILEQYLDYLERRKQLDLDIASEFITMAARLMYIKTRMLLSIEDEEAKSEMDELILSLEQRKQKDVYLNVQKITETIGKMGEFGRNTMTRSPEQAQTRSPIYVYSHSKKDLLSVLKVLSDRVGRLAQPPNAAFHEIVRREPYPVADKAGEIVERLKRVEAMPFAALFEGCRSRSELAATFIAVLELCRASVISVLGEDGDWMVRYERDAPADWTI